MVYNEAVQNERAMRQVPSATTIYSASISSINSCTCVCVHCHTCTASHSDLANSSHDNLSTSCIQASSRFIQKQKTRVWSQLYSNGCALTLQWSREQDERKISFNERCNDEWHTWYVDSNNSRMWQYGWDSLRSLSNHTMWSHHEVDILVPKRNISVLK